MGVLGAGVSTPTFSLILRSVFVCEFANQYDVASRYPKTASGKIQKFKLREMGIEMLKRRQKPLRKEGGEEKKEI